MAADFMDPGRLALFDRFLPSTLGDSPGVRRRGHLLIGSALFLCLTVSTDAAIRSLHKGTLGDIRPAHLVITILAAVVLALVPLWLRLACGLVGDRALDWVAGLVLLTVLSWIGSVGWSGDRLHGPILVALPVVPILVTFLWSQGLGLLTTLALFGALSILPLRGAGVMLGADQHPTLFQVLAGAVLFAGLFAWLYEDQRRRAEARLRQTAELYRRLFDQSKDAVAITTFEGSIIDVNRAAVELYGFPTKEAMLEHEVSGLYVDVAERRALLEEIRELGSVGGHETRQRTHDGREICVQGSTSLITDAEGRPSNLLTILRDVTEEKRNREDLMRMARYDPLTGLANRYAFDDQLEQSLARAERFERRMAVMILDLDHFKEINDRFGHAVGDGVLVAVAERLSGHIRRVDTLARLGGDELAVIKSDFDEPEHAAMMARRLLAALTLPVEVEGHRIHVEASLGIALYPPGDASGSTLLEQADLALYRAKAEGRGTFCFYDADLGKEVEARLRLAHDLVGAVEREELLLEYQPQVELVDRRVAGIEALLRWRHPELGILPPARFVAVAEDTGLMEEIGLWVLRTACGTAVRLRRRHRLPVPMAVNLSSTQIRDPDFPDILASVLTDTTLPADALELELTAEQLRDLPHGGRHCLEKLGAMGVRLTLDDFGTAPVSLEELRDLPIRKVKIDPAFVRSAAEDRGSAAIVEAASLVARRLGSTPVAEGVETEEVVEVLSRCSCSDALGYLLATPASADALSDLITSGNPWLRPWKAEP